MVIRIPTIKQIGMIIQIFLVFITVVPTYSPIGVIAVSAPSVNKPIPTVTNNAPTIKTKNIPLSMGAMVKHNAKTIAVIGKTEENASFTFCEIIVLSCDKKYLLFFTVMLLFSLFKFSKF